MDMDTYALGLRKTAKLIEDGRIDDFVKNKYASFNKGIGKTIVDKNITLEELHKHALELQDVEVDSGRQEYLESILNQILFG